jgi:predicted DNA-binding transcriptional regulator YafY
MARHSDAYDVHVGSALSKLAGLLDPPISDYVEATAAELARHPHDPQQARIFSLLTAAWANRREVVIRYPSHGAVNDRRIRVYFMEPSAAARATYVVAWDVEAEGMRHFKVERIEGCEITDEEYEIPDEFDPARYFAPSWGIMHAEPVRVELRFAPDAAARVREASWHPSQRLDEETNGWLHFEVTVAGWLEILPWILSWGSSVEVLAPPDLRQEVSRIARSMSNLYAYDAPIRPPTRRPLALPSEPLAVGQERGDNHHPEPLPED